MQSEPVRLQRQSVAGVWVFSRLGGRQARYPRPPDAVWNHCCRPNRIGIEQNRSQNGLQGIRHESTPGGRRVGFSSPNAPAARIALPQTRSEQSLRQGSPVDEVARSRGQEPPRRIGMGVYSSPRDAAIENGIAEELGGRGICDPRSARWVHMPHVHMRRLPPCHV